MAIRFKKELTTHMAESKKIGRGRPRKPGARTKSGMTFSEDFARFCKAMGALNGMTAGEWVERQLAEDRKRFEAAALSAESK